MMMTRRKALATIAACGLAWPLRLPAAMPGTEGGSERERMYFTDTVLTDQNGAQHRFYSDVLRGRTVLINFMFTGCADACPLMTARMKKVQESLGEEFGTRIHFVSLSVDVLNDTPKQLKAFATRFEVPDQGWLLLTGAPTAMQTVLQRLGERAQEREVHTSMLIAGNVGARHWRKLRPGMSPDRLSSSLLELSRSPSS